SALLGASAKSQINHDVSGLIQVGFVVTSNPVSFLNSGTGILRHDNNGLILQQGILQIDSDWTSTFSSKLVVNAYTDGD
ncbi:MAG: hypothetical protein ACI96N_002146, partial [Arenicella sp.]